MRDREKAKKQTAVTAVLRLDVADARVWQGEQLLTLTPKAFTVLHSLSEHAGRLVTKDDLMQTVWADTVVTDGTLAASIRELRKALQDDAQSPQYIETVHRRGYRFIGKVISNQSVGMPVPSSLPRSQPIPDPRPPIPPLVGRESELAQLHRQLDKALNGERQLIFVTGEPGIGKTTLVDAFLAESRDWRLEAGSASPQVSSLKSQAPSFWLGQGQCIEHYGAGEAYLPVLEALGRLCRGVDGERLIALFNQHAPTWLVQMPAFLTAAELEALQRKTQGATRERMLRELAEALEVVTAERPLILVLEDLHWSDPSTLDLLSLVARRTEPARLLIICTYRPVEVIASEHPLKTVKHELQFHNYCQELALELLSEAAIAEYLMGRFGIPPPSQGESQGEGDFPISWQRLAHLIHQCTEGNPLFLVAMVEDLIAREVFVQTALGWKLKEEAPIVASRIPDSIRQLVILQSGRLSSEARHLLEAASIAGLEFSAASVAAALGTETADIERQCEQLAERQHFLRRFGVEEWPDGTFAARYGFLHAVYQQLWHERVSPTQLQHYHRQIGERKEQAYGERAREIAFELAVHFEQGRDYRKAVQYLQQAGENAVQRSANVEAISHLTKGIELLKTLPHTFELVRQEFGLQTTLGPVLMAAKGYAAPEVEQAYARARELCQQSGETLQLSQVLSGLCGVYVVRAEHRTAYELGEQLLSLAENQHDTTCFIQAHYTLGASSFLLGELTAARAHLEQSLALYNLQEHRSLAFVYGHDPGMSSLSFAALALWQLGYPDQALRSSEAAVTLAREVAHPFSLACALTIMAWCHQLRGEGQRAKEQAEAGMALSTEHGVPLFLAMGAILRSWALAEQGQGEEGIAQIRQGMAAQRATGAEIFFPSYLAMLAEAYGKVGQAEEGLNVLAEALDRVDKTGERWYEAELYRLKGELTLQKESQKSKGKSQKSKMETDPRPLTPDPQAEAEACFQKAIAIARKQQAKSLELHATVSLSRLWQQQGKRKKAHTMLSEIYGWFTEGFDTKDLQEAKALLQELRH